MTIGFLFSCSSVDRRKNGLKSSTEDFKKLDTIVSISGCWLSEDYFNSINEFKSPLKSQDGSLYIIIPDRTLKKTTMIFNFHEGGTSLEILKNNDHYEIWEIQEDSLTQRVYKVKIISPTKISLDDKYFVKISSSTDTDNHRILEEVLFKGIYRDVNNNRVEFEDNGEIIGLNNFNFYVPVIDYYDEGMQVDQIRLGSTKNDLDYYGFKFIGDTLELYKLHCLEFDSTSNNCGVVEYGQIIHKIWRQK